MELNMDLAEICNKAIAERKRNKLKKEREEKFQHIVNIILCWGFGIGLFFLIINVYLFYAKLFSV